MKDCWFRHNELMQKLPPLLQKLFQKAEGEGVNLYLTGGYLRDFLFGRPSKDYDLAIEKRPEDLPAFLYDLVEEDALQAHGLRYGSLAWKDTYGKFQITACRKEENYDGHYPMALTFGVKWEEDAGRRDFTLNAFAWNPHRGWIDTVGAWEDYCTRRLRMIGNAQERLREDPLRILRALRFLAQEQLAAEMTLERCLTDGSFLENNLRQVPKSHRNAEMQKIFEIADLASIRSYASLVFSLYFPNISEWDTFPWKASAEKRWRRIAASLSEGERQEFRREWNLPRRIF